MMGCPGQSACCWTEGCSKSDLRFRGTIIAAKEIIAERFAPLLTKRLEIPEGGVRSFKEQLKSGTTLLVNVHRVQEGDKCFYPIYW